MQINPINNNRTNFKGNIIFKEQCIKLGENIQPINCLVIPSERIRIIGNVGEPTQKFIETKLERLCANVRKMYTVALQKYKTEILTSTGDTYIVTADCKKIFDAQKKIDGTSKFVEL